MDWSNVFVILLWLWLCRYVLGLVYGIYLMRKSPPLSWDWQDQIIAGLPFWVGYGLGRLIRWLVELRRTRSGQR